MPQLWVLVTGATGFIGQHLICALLEQGFYVLGLTRQQGKKSDHAILFWVSEFSDISQRNIDYVINLAGENIGASRWSEARKQQLIASRVGTTQALFNWLREHNIQPKRIISGSAVGFYGIDPTEQWQKNCTEQDSSQAIFMSELCQQWEAMALSDVHFDVRILRLGVVLAADGGILPQMLNPIRWNMVGRIGSGQQPFAWVHIEDVLRAILFVLKTDHPAKIYNLVAPERTSQQQFVQIASQLLKKHPIFPLPAWVLQFLLGEQSQLVLNGQYVVPEELTQARFQFKYDTLQKALSKILL